MDLLTLPTYYRRSRRYLGRGLPHLLMYVFGRFRVVRAGMVWTYSHKECKPGLTSDSSLVGVADVDEVVGKISRDGFCPDLNLRQEVVERFLTFASLATCYGDGKDEHPFRYGDANFAEQARQLFRLGRYNHALGASPVLQALTRDAQLVAIARKYLGAEPVLIGARMWWSLAGPADSEQRREAGQSFITTSTVTAAWHSSFI